MFELLSIVAFSSVYLAIKSLEKERKIYAKSRYHAFLGFFAAWNLILGKSCKRKPTSGMGRLADKPRRGRSYFGLSLGVHL
jgi:hypothetical protein